MKRALLIVGALLAATTGLSSTYAAFTDAESVEWTLTTGSIELTRDGDGLQFSSAALAPGDTATGTVRVRNSGDRSFGLTLSREHLESTQPGGCAVRDALALKIVEDVDGDPLTTGDRTTVLDGPLATAATSSALGALAPAAARSYELTLTFVAQHGAGAADNDNCFQGSIDRERFAWNAVEAQ